jgi:hypothetical protein
MGNREFETYNDLKDLNKPANHPILKYQHKWPVTKPGKGQNYVLTEN